MDCTTRGKPWKYVQVAPPPETHPGEGPRVGVWLRRRGQFRPLTFRVPMGVPWGFRRIFQPIFGAILCRSNAEKPSQGRQIVWSSRPQAFLRLYSRGYGPSCGDYPGTIHETVDWSSAKCGGSDLEPTAPQIFHETHGDKRGSQVSSLLVQSEVWAHWYLILYRQKLAENLSPILGYPQAGDGRVFDRSWRRAKDT